MSKSKNSQPERHTRSQGRPMTRTPAERIPDTPENIAKAVLQTPPKADKDWKYSRK